MTLSVAAAQPVCVAKDVVANAHAHADAIRAADARVVVFPELSLTGYELDADVVAPDDPGLAPIVEACAACDAVALVGAPVAGDYIAMLFGPSGWPAARATGHRERRAATGCEALAGLRVVTSDSYRLI